MVQQPGLGGAMVERHHEGLLREIHGEPGPHRPANHGTRVEGRGPPPDRASPPWSRRR
jgi:hypothetical protein